MFCSQRFNTLHKILLAHKSSCAQFSDTRDGRTHYEVLKLQSSCTEKDIKQSFARLSKECHPDVSNHINSHNQFVRLVEAYSTLSKPSLRAKYDLTINIRKPNLYRPRSGPGTNEEYYYRNWMDDPYIQKGANFTHQTNRNRPKYSKPYESRDSIKVSNLFIAGVCIVVAMISVALQFMFICSAVERSNAIITKKTMENSLIITDLREKARLMSNEESAAIILNLNQLPKEVFRIETDCD